MSHAMGNAANKVSSAERTPVMPVAKLEKSSMITPGVRQKEYGIRNATMPRRTASQPTLLGLASAKAAPA